MKIDPGYADAWAALANLYLDEHRYNYNSRPDPLNRALDAARRAVSLDPANQRAHWALAQVHFFRRELDRFFPEAERAIALNPNNASVVAGLGGSLHYAGDDRGIALVKKAMALDPFHPTWFNLPLAVSHFERGEYEEALAVALKIDMPGYVPAQVHLAAIYAELGRQAEAGSAIEELLKLYPGFTTAKYIEGARKWNRTDEAIHLWVAALRKAGLPEGAEA